MIFRSVNILISFSLALCMITRADNEDVVRLPTFISETEMHENMNELDVNALVVLSCK